MISIHSCSFPIPTFFSQYSQTVDGSWFWTHFLVPWFFHFYYRFWASSVCNIIVLFFMKSSVILLNSCSLPSFLCRYLLALRYLPSEFTIFFLGDDFFFFFFLNRPLTWVFYLLYLLSSRCLVVLIFGLLWLRNGVGWVGVERECLRKKEARGLHFSLIRKGRRSQWQGFFSIKLSSGFCRTSFSFLKTWSLLLPVSKVSVVCGIWKSKTKLRKVTVEVYSVLGMTS